MPEVQHNARQRALCIVGPGATRKNKRGACFTRHTQLPSEWRAWSVERTIRLRDNFLQFTFRRDAFLLHSPHLDQNTIRLVAVYFLSWPCLAIQNQARYSDGGQPENALL